MHSRKGFRLYHPPGGPFNGCARDAAGMARSRWPTEIPTRFHDEPFVLQKRASRGEMDSALGDPVHSTQLRTQWQPHLAVARCLDRAVMCSRAPAHNVSRAAAGRHHGQL